MTCFNITPPSDKKKYIMKYICLSIKLWFKKFKQIIIMLLDKSDREFINTNIPPMFECKKY